MKPMRNLALAALAGLALSLAPAESDGSDPTVDIKATRALRKIWKGGVEVARHTRSKGEPF